MASQGAAQCWGPAAMRYVYQEQHAEGDTTTEHMLVYKLTSPYTVSMQPPTVDIAFGTPYHRSQKQEGISCQMGKHLVLGRIRMN